MDAAAIWTVCPGGPVLPVDLLLLLPPMYYSASFSSTRKIFPAEECIGWQLVGRPSNVEELYNGYRSGPGTAEMSLSANWIWCYVIFPSPADEVGWIDRSDIKAGRSSEPARWRMLDVLWNCGVMRADQNNSLNRQFLWREFSRIENGMYLFSNSSTYFKAFVSCIIHIPLKSFYLEAY